MCRGIFVQTQDIKRAGVERGALETAAFWAVSGYRQALDTQPWFSKKMQSVY